MFDIANHLRLSDYTLRSGGADGSDRAFYDGASGSIYSNRNKQMEIYLPWEGFNGLNSNDAGIYLPSKFDNHQEAMKIASTVHPYWDKLKPAVRLLHARNVYQILGKDLNTPSKSVICYAPPLKSGRVKGGTATAVELALRNKIPVINLYYRNVREIAMQKYSI